jgi:hypothetical protein
MSLSFTTDDFGNTAFAAEALMVFLYKDDSGKGLCSNAQPLNNATVKKVLFKREWIIQEMPIQFIVYVIPPWRPGYPKPSSHQVPPQFHPLEVPNGSA